MLWQEAFCLNSVLNSAKVLCFKTKDICILLKMWNILLLCMNHDEWATLNNTVYDNDHCMLALTAHQLNLSYQTWCNISFVQVRLYFSVVYMYTPNCPRCQSCQT